MTDWTSAVHAVPEGVVLDVEILAGASKDVFPAGFNVWRKRIEARVMAVPIEGRANAALVRLIAQRFALPTRDVRVIAGAASRQKRVLLVGVSRETILASLG